YGNIDALEAGAKMTVTGSDISLPDNLATGSWYAILVVDATNAVVESNEDNNQTETAITAQGLAPDLLITNMALFPVVIVAGSNVRITFNVANNGPVQAAPVKTTFYLSVDEVLDQSDLKVCEVSTRLLGGKTNLLMYSGFVMSSQNLPGQYFLIGMVDKEGLVTESDETNNQYVQVVTLAGTTGIFTNPLGDGLLVYPVPADDRLFVEFPGIAGDKVLITISDLIGRILFREERVVSESNRIEINTSTWPAGSGIVRISLKDKVMTGRFITK
ncbi:MAG: CARDB domain-containing protein, partial [Bacteroidales bacterium]